jgi:hypothetical protein
MFSIHTATRGELAEMYMRLRAHIAAMEDGPRKAELAAAYAQLGAFIDQRDRESAAAKETFTPAMREGL